MNMEIDIDWQKLAAYAVIRIVEPAAFRACLHEMRSRGLVIDSLERREMEEMIGEQIPEAAWLRFVRWVDCCDGKPGYNENWDDAWTRFRDSESVIRKLMEVVEGGPFSTPKWHFEYEIDAFGTWDTEAETEKEAWEKFKQAWHAGEISPPKDFGNLDADNVTIYLEEE